MQSDLDINVLTKNIIQTTLARCIFVGCNLTNFDAFNLHCERWLSMSKDGHITGATALINFSSVTR